MSNAELQKNFPTILENLGSNWFESQLRLPRNERHLLFRLMQVYVDTKPKIDTMRNQLPDSQKIDEENLKLAWFVDSLTMSSEPVEFLESSLTELKSDSGFQSLIKELKSDERKFLSAVSVATIACYFKERGKIQLYPKIDLGGVTKIPDLLVNLNGRPIYVEVTTPGFASNISKSNLKAVFVKERAAGQILDEFKENFEDAVTKGLITNEPIIIVPDCSFTEIDDFSIELALSTYSMTQKYPNTEMITGILWYKRATIKDHKTFLNGKYYPNEKAKNSLLSDELEKL